MGRHDIFVGKLEDNFVIETRVYHTGGTLVVKKLVITKLMAKRLVNQFYNIGILRDKKPQTKKWTRNKVRKCKLETIFPKMSNKSFPCVSRGDPTSNFD